MPRPRESGGAPGSGAASLTRAGWAAGVTRVSYLSLLAQQALDAWVHQMPPIFWAAKLLPLLIFLPGVLGGRLRSHIWLCFVCLLYFIRLVEHLFADPHNPLNIAGMLAVVTLFNAAMLFVRWRARELRAGPGADGAAT